MIPRILHQIWLGSEPPEDIDRYVSSWRRHHPAWEHRLWTDSDLFDFENRDSFDSAPSWAMKADILRYEILFRHGGIYVDADFECHRPIDPLLSEDRSVLLVSEFGTVCNSFIGASPGSNFLELCRRELRARMAHTSLDDWVARPHLVTGPGLVDHAYCQSGLSFSDPFCLLPGDYFFEPRSRVPALLHDAERKRYATHRAHASWVRPTLSHRVRSLKPWTRWRRFLDLSHP